jgi:ATP-dependent Clp protease ATP-binding subunit ClpC
MGFEAASTGSDNYEQMKEKVLEEAKRIFKPEFLNRINDQIVFRPLTRDDLFKIIDLEIKKVAKRLDERKITVEFTGEAKALILDKGYDVKYGARPLRRAIERYFEDPLAEALLRGDVKNGEPLTVIREEDHLAFRQDQSVTNVSSE